MNDKVEIEIIRNDLGERSVRIPDGWAPTSPLINTCAYCGHGSHIIGACVHGEPDRCMCVFGIPVKRINRDVLGDEQVDAWLRENCRRSGPNWVWPRGTTYTQEQSREIVRIHLSLGMGPTEMITVEMIGHLLRRIESLEKLFGALGAPGAVTRPCPCLNGKHYPSDTNCRWCQCHRENNGGLLSPGQVGE